MAMILHSAEGIMYKPVAPRIKEPDRCLLREYATRPVSDWRTISIPRSCFDDSEGVDHDDVHYNGWPTPPTRVHIHRVLRTWGLD